MADFNDDHKTEQGQYFSEGIHKVKIVGIDGGENENGKEYIEFIVEGENGEEGNARMWFTTDKAIKFTFSSIRNIFVHNALKGKEEAAKDMVNKVKNSDELIDLCNKALIGKEAWYVVEKSDYTYTNAAGEEKQGYNRNIFGYEPKPKAKTAVQETFPDATEISEQEVPDGVF